MLDAGLARVGLAIVNVHVSGAHPVGDLGEGSGEGSVLDEPVDQQVLSVCKVGPDPQCDLGQAFQSLVISHAGHLPTVR
jgi:hypothetical protein